MERMTKSVDYADIDCSIDIYDQEFEFRESTGATDGDDDIHTANQTANYPYNTIVRKSFKNREKLLSIKPFSKDYDSISVKFVKTDDTVARNNTSRKHPYEKCNINVFEEFK